VGADAVDHSGSDVTEQKPPVSPVDVAQQMREAAERMITSWSAAAGSAAGAASAMSRAAGSASGAGVALPGGSAADMPTWPSLPATFSAEKVQRMLDDLADRRNQVQGLRDSLAAVDEQLGQLEAGLGPMLEWTRGWAELEKTMSGFWRPPRGASESKA